MTGEVSVVVVVVVVVVVAFLIVVVDDIVIMTLIISHPERENCWVFANNTSAGHLTSLESMK